ncbi:MAG: hypothetical protein RLZZ244_214 [Verrucomicrobiota bacterium]
MKIRLIKRPGKKDLWQVDVGKVNGRRMQKAFASRSKAEAFLEMVHSEGQASVAMPAQDRTDFYRSKARLEAVGATLTEAVDFFLAHKATTKPAPPLPDLISEYNLHLYSTASQKYADGATRIVSKILKVTDSVFGITRDLIAALVAEGKTAGTQGNYRTAFSSFCSWLLAQRYIAIHPLEGRGNRITIRKSASDGPKAFGVREVKAVLHACLFGRYDAFDRHTGQFYRADFRDCIGAVACSLFAGLRPNEVAKTDLRSINLYERWITVSSEASKTNQRRVVNLDPAAVAWLRLWRWCNPDAQSIVPVNFDRKRRALVEVAGVEWIHNAFRHTFASMHYAAHQNTALLKVQMGHAEGEAVLHQHYRAVQTSTGEVITKRMAEEFWRLTPARVRDLR